MDVQTLETYDSGAVKFTSEWGEQPAPADMYELLLRFFKPGPTADVGCGSGRDVAWLVSNGFDARGFDASEGLIRQASALYPSLQFDYAALPALETLERGSYENVLCETVIMHLPTRTISAAARSLVSLLRPGGTLYLSWRVTNRESFRDASGRLYSAFDANTVLSQLDPSMTVLFDAESVSLSSGKSIHRLVIRKTGDSTW